MVPGVSAIYLVGLLWLSQAPPTTANPPQEKPAAALAITAITPVRPTRGSPITITASGLDDGSDPIYLRLAERDTVIQAKRKAGEGNAQYVDYALRLTRAADKLTGTIPVGLKLGDYLVALSRKPDEPVADYSLPLHIAREAQTPLAISAINPVFGYPVNQRFRFILLGEGFSDVPGDNILIIDGQDEIHADWSKDQPAEDDVAGRVYGHYVSPHKLEFWGIPNDFQGRIKVRLRVGDTVSEPVTTTLVPVSRRTPLVIAGGLTLGFAFLVLFVATRGVGQYKIDDATFSSFATLFIDKETDTYSLDKFQLYSWTSVAIFGYIYLTIARSLIQGNMDFAAIPDNLPGLIFISASTTALSRGIASARGPMGAGEIRPSFADFITDGGVVSAERFQYFVWTVLGVLTFLFLLISIDPAELHDLPKVPESFLYMMGVSSAGYLGGKLARRPGPVIDSIVAQQSSLVLDVQGRRLSRSASFQIDDTEITYDLKTADGTTPGGASKDAVLEVVQPDEDAQNPEYARRLRLTMAKPEDWIARKNKPEELLSPPAEPADPNNKPKPKKVRFTIINPDGQKAVGLFEVNRKPA
jgi:hypothetical protein